MEYFRLLGQLKKHGCDDEAVVILLEHLFSNNKSQQEELDRKLNSQSLFNFTPKQLKAIAENLKQT